MEGEKRIEKYQFSLKNILGQGSYATVYLGRTIDTLDNVAVKVIDKRMFINAYNLKNVQSQIQIMKKVQHENIVKLHDIYQTSNNMYIVTEMCDTDLYRVLQERKKIPQKQAKAYLRCIMDGVQYLQENGIIHRDLKPANILLKDNICKISDFGFAKSLEDNQSIMKSIVGTPLYMSPQILKRVKYTKKSDLWSIGLIYYQMLHGQTPWRASNQLELINGIYNKKIAFSKNISERSKDFIQRCLQIREEDRMDWQQAFNHNLLKKINFNHIKSIFTSVITDDKQNLNVTNSHYSKIIKNHTNQALNKDGSVNKIKPKIQTLAQTPKGQNSKIILGTPNSKVKAPTQKLKKVMAITPNKKGSEVLKKDNKSATVKKIK